MYGVRAMLALAAQNGSKPLMVREIAEHHNLPPTYLEQLMVLLKKAGLVHATRGAHGGYVLARPAARISLLEIIEVLEGPLILADCPGGAGCCGQPETCALQEIWDTAAQQLQTHFQDISLANLAERQRDKLTAPALMYDI